MKPIVKASIIIPVYNVEHYIDTCISSLIDQTLSEIEIIFVNDFSPDSSKDLIEQAMRRDNRIDLINS